MSQDGFSLNRRRFLAGTSATAITSPFFLKEAAAAGESYGNRQFVRARYIHEIKDGSPSDYLTGYPHDFPGLHFEPDSNELFLNKFIRENGQKDSGKMRNS